jgi:putative oxidoreductase
MSRLISYASSEKSKDLALLILRIAFGLSMFYGHGAGKIGRLFGGEEIKFADPFGLGPVASLALAAFAEAICSILVTLGLFTRWALIPLIITMGVAFFMVHISDEFSRQEKAILFGVTYIALFITGPGKLSLDYLFFGKKS